jgi:DNA-binding MarR family transcriptional regulator
MAKVSPADAAKLWEGLTRAHNAMTAALEKDLLPEAGTPLAWFEVLHHLTRAPGGLMRFQELAKVSGLSDSGASRRIEQMIKAGLIERQDCPTDRRGAFAHLTDKGRSAHKRAHQVFVKSLQRNLGGHLDPSEAGSLRKALERLGQADSPHPTLPAGRGGNA